MLKSCEAMPVFPLFIIILLNIIINTHNFIKLGTSLHFNNVYIYTVKFRNKPWGLCFLKTLFNPFAPGDFAEKRVLKLVEWFSDHCRAIKS